MKSAFSAILALVLLLPSAALSQITEVHLYHDSHSGAEASQFRIENLGTAIYLTEASAVPVWVGNSQTGVSIGYGGCASSPTYLGTVYYSGNVGCDDLQILEDPASGSFAPIYVDCLANTMTFPDIRLEYDPCRVNAPSDIQPVNNATTVSLTPTLSWYWEGNDNCTESIGLPLFEVYFGTDPANLTVIGSVVGVPDSPAQLAVGPLELFTKYYWRVEVTDEFYDCPGFHTVATDVQCFTTLGTVLTETSTWGAIKSMYR